MPSSVVNDGTTHVSDLTLGTLFNKPSDGNTKKPPSAPLPNNLILGQTQGRTMDKNINRNETRCVSVEEPMFTTRQVQNENRETEGVDIEPQQRSQYLEMAQVSPGSIVRSIHESTAPVKMLGDIGEMDLFSWDDVDHPEGKGATNTQERVEEPIGKVGSIGDLKFAKVYASN